MSDKEDKEKTEELVNDYITKEFSDLSDSATFLFAKILTSLEVTEMTLGVTNRTLGLADTRLDRLEGAMGLRVREDSSDER